ncbi:hypothetical protein ASG29_08085 [Sphingomonas sp. Leaf412]|nr:hypothetical protein ASG29_08085 [Sphingomonas sp. Leaf412]
MTCPLKFAQQRLMRPAANCIRIAVRGLTCDPTHTTPAFLQRDDVTKKPCLQFLANDAVDHVDPLLIARSRFQSGCGGRGNEFPFQDQAIVLVTVNKDQ